MAILISQELRIKLVAKLVAKLRLYLRANLLRNLKCLLLTQSNCKVIVKLLLGTVR